LTIRNSSPQVIDAGANGKPLYDFLLVTNSNLQRIFHFCATYLKLFVAIAPKRRELGKGLLLITNRNSYMGFPLVPRSAASDARGGHSATLISVVTVSETDTET